MYSNSEIGSLRIQVLISRIAVIETLFYKILGKMFGSRKKQNEDNIKDAA